MSDNKDLEWAVELASLGLCKGQGHASPLVGTDAEMPCGSCRKRAVRAVAALAEPLRQSQRVENEITQLARRVVEWDAEEIPRLEKRIEELEAALREAETHIRCSCPLRGCHRHQSPAAYERRNLLDTEAKP